MVLAKTICAQKMVQSVAEQKKEVEEELVVLLFAAAYNKTQSCCSGQSVMNRPCQRGSGEWI